MVLAELNNVGEPQAHQLLGVLDSTYLFAYAFFMFLRCVAFMNENLELHASLILPLD